MKRPLRLAFLAALIAAGLSSHDARASIPSNFIPYNNWQRNSATLDLDFVHDTYWLNGTAYSTAAGNCTSLAANPASNCASAFITGAGATFTRAGTTNVTWAGSPFYTDSTQGQAFVSRASSATYFDNTGTLQTATTNTARSSTYSYNGSSWVANSGTLIEPAATNGLTNNTMVGVIAYNTTELTNNGTFSGCSGSTCTGWTVALNSGTGTVSFGSNTATITGDGTNQAAIRQSITTVSGTSYNFTVTVGAANPSLVQVGTSSGGNQLLASTTANAGTTMTFVFTATSTTSWIQIGVTNAVTATVSSVSVQSAGALPTGWQQLSVGTGLAFRVIGSGTESGINYVDVRWFGTIANASLFPGLTFGSSCTMFAATQFGLVTTSTYIKLQAGSLANMSFTGINIHAKSAACADPGTTIGTSLNSISSASLSTQRWTVSTTASTFSNSSTAYAVSALSFETITVGNAVDVTFRIGMPQMEAGTIPTSVIATSSAAVTRSADVVSFPSGGTYFNSSGVLKTAPPNTPRLDHSPTGNYWPEGILIEESRTNSIRNNTMQGAVAADGIERTTGGTFSGCSGATCTGWTTTVNAGTGSVSFGSNTATLTGDGTNAASIYQAITTVSGYAYIIAVTTGAGQSVTVQAGTTAGGATLLSASSVAASTTTKYQFTASGTTSYVQINNANATLATVTTVSVQSAGEFPTNWVYGSLGGLSTQIVGTGTESGISYVDIRFFGTSTSTFSAFFTEANKVVAASSGQNWTQSTYIRVVGGTTTGLQSGANFTIDVTEYDSSGTFLQDNAVSVAALSSSALSGNRSYNAVTLSNASTAYVRPRFSVNFTNGAAVDITLRIGMPQLELGAFPTSVIPTSGSTVTRAADTFTVPVTAAGANGAWYTQGVGTLVANAMIPYEIGSGTSDSAMRLVDINDGTAANGLDLEININNFPWQGQATLDVSSGFTYNVFTGTSFSNNTLIKGALSYDGTHAYSAFNGTSLSSSSSAAVSSALTELVIGRAITSNIVYLNGWMNRVTYFPTAQPNYSLPDYTR